MESVHWEVRGEGGDENWCQRRESNYGCCHCFGLNREGLLFPFGTFPVDGLVGWLFREEVGKRLGETLLLGWVPAYLD